LSKKYQRLAGQEKYTQSGLSAKNLQLLTNLISATDKNQKVTQIKKICRGINLAKSRRIKILTSRFDNK